MQLLLSTVIIFLTIIKLDALVKFTNVKCTSLDPSFAQFRYCNLKVPQRGQIALNAYVELYKLPINNLSVIVSLQKKASGYHPFLYNNYTVDLCNFLSNKKRQPFMKILYDMQVRYTNMNHTCPFNHDIIVKNFILQEDTFFHLPLPSGDYQIECKAGFPPDEWISITNIYFLVVGKD